MNTNEHGCYNVALKHTPCPIESTYTKKQDSSKILHALMFGCTHSKLIVLTDNDSPVTATAVATHLSSQINTLRQRTLTFLNRFK